MVNFKSCPRCKGDMHVNTDMYGTYRECLMCGYMVNLREVVKTSAQAQTQTLAKAKRYAA